MLRLIIAVWLITSLGGCATGDDAPCAPGVGSPVAVFTLFMGRAIAGREDLTDGEWQSFLNDTVTANLANGFTVFDADGGWMNPITHKTVEQHTKVLLVALPETPESLAAVDRVRSAYQSRFHQQSVGMTVAPACAAF